MLHYHLVMKAKRIAKKAESVAWGQKRRDIDPVDRV